MFKDDCSLRFVKQAKLFLLYKMEAGASDFLAATLEEERKGSIRGQGSLWFIFLILTHGLALHVNQARILAKILPNARGIIFLFNFL